jgi:hypothetical protein
MTGYRVKLEPSGVWLSTWRGDPGRTCVKESAKLYPTMSSATYALAYARRYHDYLQATIEEAKE